MKNQVFRHIKSGGLYVVTDDRAVWEPTLEPVVTYQSLETKKRFVRLRSVFEDGRFEAISKDEMLQISRTHHAITARRKKCASRCLTARTKKHLKNSKSGTTTETMKASMQVIAPTGTDGSTTANNEHYEPRQSNISFRLTLKCG